MKVNMHRITGIRLVVAAVLSAAVLTTVLLPSAARAAETVVEGSFEGGSFGAGWVHGAGRVNGNENASWADHTVVLDLPYTGTYSALLGYKYTPVAKDRYGYMYSEVTIPADASSSIFSFRYRQQGFDGRGYDPFVVTARDLAGNVLATIVDASFDDQSSHYKDSGWIDVSYDMSAFAGQPVRLDFRQYNLQDNKFETWVFVDDVSCIYTKHVDLAVDGNGDDVFGDPGTGSGGISVSSGVAGGTVTYLIDIENEGLDIDSYTVTASSPAGWSALIRYGGVDYTSPWATPAVAAGTSITAEIIVTIPAGTPAGSYMSIVDAVSVSDLTRYDSVTLSTGVIVVPYVADLVIDGDGLGVTDPAGNGGASTGSTYPGSFVDYAIELVNTGGQQDDYTVSFDFDPGVTAEMIDGAVTHTAPFNSGTIDPGDSRTYTLRVTADPTFAGGDYISHVYAASSGDPSAIDGVTATLTVIAPVLDLIVDGSGDGAYDPSGSGLGGTATLAGLRGTTVYFPIVVQNEGGVADSYTFTWDRPTGNWSAVINDGAVDHAFPWTSPPFAPGEERTYTLAITIPNNAAFNTWPTILDAVSVSDSRIEESVTAVVMVSDKIGVDIVIDGDGDNVYGAVGTGAGGFSAAVVAPGDTVNFTIEIQNEGGANTHDIQWNVPAGWSVLLDGQASPVAALPEGTYTLQVIVPPAAPAGTFDIVIDGIKSNKPFYVDSATGRITVAPARLVDGLIDGAGDDVFGSAGLGDGGTSVRGTVAGVTVSFIVEIQNQGAFDESYTVTWSSPAGWTGTLDGAGQPFPTGVIVSGGSMTYLFSATVPLGEAPADYDYAIDIVSDADPLNSESLTARVTVYPPPTVDLVKAVDLAAARPGDVVTYTITYSNPSAADIVEIEIVDPVPLEMELVLGAYGPGGDIAWTTGAGTVYLTADSTDADEALFDPGSGQLQVIMSRQAPYTLSAGESGTIEFQVRVR